MKLQPLTLITPKIQVSEIFPALELIMSHQAISEAIAETNSQEKRNRLLPTHLIIALVIALSLWSKDSVVDVLKNLLQGLSAKWIPLGMKWKTPSKSSISEARQRVGCAVMTRLFEKLAQPMATMETPSAFLKGLRWMAIDGTLFDSPDTAENSQVFGDPGSRKGTKAAFPKARLVILVELGTHIITDALLMPLANWRKSSSH